MNRELYKCVIVDDEPIATRIINGYVEKTGRFEQPTIFHNAMDTMDFLRNNTVDIVFLDIQMPGITGLEFIKSLLNPPSVIFTTAHRNYAADAFDLNAIDYLVKPISFERFLQAINKFMGLHSKSTVTSAKKDYIIFKSDKKNHKIFFEEIIYIESLDDYIKVHLQNKSLVCYMRLSAILRELPGELFIRVHRSFIININSVTAFTAGQAELGPVKIPIGRNYKEDTLNRLQG